MIREETTYGKTMHLGRLESIIVIMDTQKTHDEVFTCVRVCEHA